MGVYVYIWKNEKSELKKKSSKIHFSKKWLIASFTEICLGNIAGVIIKYSVSWPSAQKF